jgi:hypothetical protein
MKRLGLIVLGTVLVGCVSLTPEGKKVRITNNPETVKGCTFLKNVRSTSTLSGNVEGLAASANEKTLQNDTAALGGNVLYVISSGRHASGEAYRCGEPTPAPD